MAGQQNGEILIIIGTLVLICSALFMVIFMIRNKRRLYEKDRQIEQLKLYYEKKIEELKKGDNN